MDVKVLSVFIFYLMIPPTLYSFENFIKSFYANLLNSSFLTTFYGRALRGLCYYYFYIPALIDSLYVLLKKDKYYLLRIALLSLIAFLNISFFFSYWGFYYRNPWANHKLINIPFNATVTNQMFYSLHKFQSVQDKVVMACLSVGSVDMLDIYGMYHGIPGLNTLSIYSKIVPANISNYLLNLPDVYISCPNQVLSNLSVYSFITIGQKYKINIYYFNNSSNEIVIFDGPIASPVLSPSYFNDLLIWKSRIPAKWVYGFGGFNWSNSVARVSFRLQDAEVVDSCNLTVAFLKKYKYILVKNVRDPAAWLIFESKSSRNVKSVPYFLYPDWLIVKNDVLIESDRLLPFLKQIGEQPYCIINAEEIYGANKYTLAVVNGQPKP